MDSMTMCMQKEALETIMIPQMQSCMRDYFNLTGYQLPTPLPKYFQAKMWMIGPSKLLFRVIYQFGNALLNSQICIQRGFQSKRRLILILNSK